MAERSWRLDQGPEWDQHRIQVDPNLERFEENFQALRFVLERDPFARLSSPLFEDENERVIATRDFMEGFELVVVYEVFESNRSCTLKWTKLRRLTDEEILWGAYHFHRGGRVTPRRLDFA